MASSKRQPSKSKRYRQNKAVREARAARSARAGEATAISRGEREAGPTDTVSAATANSGDAGARGGKGGTTASSKGRRKPAYTIPGQRAVVLAFMFTIVSAATLLIAPIQVPREVPADDPRVEEDAEVGDDGMVEIFVEGKLLEEEPAPVAALVLIAPVAITGAALWFTKRPQRSTAWSIAMVAMAGYVFFVGSYAIISLPSLVALAVAGFQSRRADNKVRVAELKAQRAARKAAKASKGKGGDVIDVDSTEVDVTDDQDANDEDSDAPR